MMASDTLPAAVTAGGRAVRALTLLEWPLGPSLHLPVPAYHPDWDEWGRRPACRSPGLQGPCGAPESRGTLPWGDIKPHSRSDYKPLSQESSFINESLKGPNKYGKKSNAPPSQEDP